MLLYGVFLILRFESLAQNAISLGCGRACLKMGGFVSPPSSRLVSSGLPMLSMIYHTAFGKNMIYDLMLPVFMRELQSANSYQTSLARRFISTRRSILICSLSTLLKKSQGTDNELHCFFFTFHFSSIGETGALLKRRGGSVLWTDPFKARHLLELEKKASFLSFSFFLYIPHSCHVCCNRPPLWRYYTSHLRTKGNWGKY